jgi:predicted RNA-binding Zn ribbon-like protein
LSAIDIQPGGRRPAPGQLALVQAFLNTHFDLVGEHGSEVLHSPSAAAAWFSAQGLLPQGTRVSAADLQRVLALRRTLRDMVRAGEFAELDAQAAGLPCELRFAAGGPQFVAAAQDGIAGALGALLGITAAAMLDGRWARLKLCPGPHCDWAFYDHSRNQSGRWCSMSVCGGRVKARAHYHRRRVP